MFGRTKIAVLVAEFLGAATLTTVVLSVANSRIGFPLFIAAATGLAAGLLVLILGKTSGAHANPAVTLGLWSLRRIPTTQAIAYVAAQLAGGLAALSLYQYLSGQTLSDIAGKEFSWQVLVAEAVGAFVFCFGLASAVIQRFQGGTWAFTVGASLALGMVAASVASNALVNPAVAVGVLSVSRAYIVGPLVGALVGMNLYKYLFEPAKPSVAARVKTVAKRVSRRR